MRIKLLTIICFFFLCVSTQAAPHQFPKRVYIGIPETVALANPGKVKSLFKKIWAGAYNPKPWVGWIEYRHTPTGDIWYVWIFSKQQIKKPANFTQWKTVWNHANIKWDKDISEQQLRDKYNLERVQGE